jgi:putative NIF3 family GTP cyclohydrolase 1 type 2
MNRFTISRRRFCKLAGASCLTGPAVLRGQQAKSISAREVVARIRQNVGVPWRTPTADEFKVGDPDAPITGITTTFMSTLDVLKKSAAAGNNFIVTHEPTFWSANDEVSTLREDRLYRVKLKFIQENKLVIWRFHDHWHAHRPDGIFLGWNKAVGWDKYAVTGANPFSHQYEIPAVSLQNLAEELPSKLNVKSMRIVGDPALMIRRVGNGGHYITQAMQILPQVDLLLMFESREWEAAEYVRDAVAASQQKALIQLPHEGGEEAGMDECARWLREFVPEVPVTFIPSGDPFWMPV